MLDHRHELYRLAGLIEWEQFGREFGRFYRPLGRPAKLTRLMVGLSYLKHVFDLSGEAVCARWRENPYWQFFCGCEYFQHELPCDPSSLTRWRRRIGPAGMEKLLAATVQAGLKSGTVKPSSLKRVSIDTTVQPKAIAHPTDSRLYLKAIQALAGQFSPMLGLVERLLAQHRTSKNKLYSLHAPEVVCIAKGKADKPYEFGCKVALAVTNREGFALAAKALPGNP